MPNPFSVIPVDIVGQQQAYRQNLARTAQQEGLAAEMPVRMDILQQQSQENQIKLQRDRQQLAELQAYSQASQAVKQTGNLMQDLQTKIGLALEHDQFQAADGMLRQLSALQRANEDAVYKQAFAEEKSARARSDRATMIEKLYSGVTDPQRLAFANSMYKTLMGEDPPQEFRTFSPGLGAWAREAAAKQKSSADLAVEEARLKVQQSRLGLEQQRIELTRQRDESLKDAREARIAHLNKTGGKSSVPNRQQVANAEDVLREHYTPAVWDKLPQKDRDGISRQLAEDAAALQRGGEFRDVARNVLKENPKAYGASETGGFLGFGKTTKPTFDPSARRTTQGAPAAKAGQNVTKDQYDKLKSGEKYWWNGEQLTKK